MPTAAADRTAPPRATYRVQVNQGFTFADAAAIVPYLHDLGISHLYTSPYLQARPGSLHGYDISDHGELNRELGGEALHAEMVEALHERGMGHLLDIVPNHMGIGEPGNHRWNDVLRHGPASPSAHFFDIEWHPLEPGLEGKVLLPILGGPFGEVLERGEIALRYDDEEGFTMRYFDHVLPVAPRSLVPVLDVVLQRMKAPPEDPHLLELESIRDSLHHLPSREHVDPASVRARLREDAVIRRRLAELRRASPEMRGTLDRTLEAANGTAGDPASFDLLEEVLDDQAYRLAYWRVAAEEINYRRFFDINDLAGVRVEHPHVFEETHRLILRLVEEGKVDGLRIDHPDGLYDPAGYLERLHREAASLRGSDGFYILVEKILTGEEPLPEGWPVAGTVGYDFLMRAGGLFVAGENESRTTEAYQRATGARERFSDLAYRKKKLVLRASLASELTVLSDLLRRLALRDRRTRDFTLGTLTEVLQETIASFPVYRTYIDAARGQVSADDRAHVEQAIRLARRRNPAISRAVFGFLRDLLLLEHPEPERRAEDPDFDRFVMKFQQLTGPVMAKGVEDTAFYVFNRLVSLNEVGGEPAEFGTTPADFHHFCAERQRHWPHAMSSSSTHDTKRSEDVRARIHVLSEMPEEWERRVLRWMEINAPHSSPVEGDPAPSPNDEYLLYQTLVGAWPLEPFSGDAQREAFAARIRGYMEKATREAKVHTSWIDPDEEYDEAVARFVDAILDPERAGPFLEDLQEFQAPIARWGMVNALAQTLIKLTAPGIPDLYQGQELWDLSLVDPDNRRPVDYDRRREALASIRDVQGAGLPDLARELRERWEDGRIKLHVTRRALQLRADRPDLFANGDYIPLHLEGERREHAVAFARSHEENRCLVVVPRLLATLAEASAQDPLTEPTAWGDTRLAPSQWLTGRWRDRLSGAVVEVGEDEGVEIGRLLTDLPVALLVRAG
jgi:(1->4)-alpha-D-glucan 1-alpha-D-glucosylmutase